jgi:Tol biopolymer transport system component
MKRTSLPMLACAILVLAALLPGTSRPAAAASIGGTIAYVRYQAGNGTDIRLIEPNGANDRLILTVPDSPIGHTPTLAWRPDATELAFASDHEAPTSLYEKDIYAIRPNGRGLRKLTNGPERGKLASYPKGSVTVDVVMASGAGPALIYIAGAAEPQTVTSSGRLTFRDVGDFGAGAVQGMVGIVGPRRWYSPGVDVQAGQTVHAGTLRISGSADPRRADRPGWPPDGKRVGFMAGEYCGEFRTLPANPPINALGETLLAAHSSLGVLCLVDWGPTPALANQLLYNEENSSLRGIYRTTEGSGQPGELLVTYDIFHLLVDLKWLPDGTGFLFSAAEFRNGGWVNSNLYEYLFATRQLRQITTFTDEFADRFSISPDGQWIAFERAVKGAFTDLWLVRRDGTSMQLLARKAGNPAWSRRTPQATLNYLVYIPAAMR